MGIVLIRTVRVRPKLNSYSKPRRVGPPCAPSFFGGEMEVMFHVKHFEKVDGDYIDIFGYEDDRYPYQFFVGGRGTGKTYSVLRGAVEINQEYGDKFIFMRRTDKELERLMESRLRGEVMNPFKSVNDDFNWKYGIREVMKGVGSIYWREPDAEGKLQPKGDAIGYAIAMSTVASLRGIDLTDCARLIWDEFITERHVRKMTAEGEAFLNAIETVGRNRELRGKKPLKVYCMANAFNIYNPIFIELGIVDKVERMVNSRQYDWYDKERGLAVHLLKNTEGFNRKKRETALYRLTKGTAFADMALNNDFVYNDFTNIGWRRVTGYQPVLGLGDWYLWKKRGERKYYATYTPGRCMRYKITNACDRRYVNMYYGDLLKKAVIAGNVYYETYQIKEEILNLLNIK